VNVAQAGVAECGDDAESHECVGMIFGDGESQAKGIPEARDRLDDVIGGDNGDDGVGIFFVKHGRG